MHNDGLPFYEYKDTFKIAFADLDNDGDEDMVLGRLNVNGIIYFENTATAGTKPTFVNRKNIPNGGPVNGPFTRLTTATGHWAPEKLSQAAFYDLDNDNDLDMVLGGKTGTARYYENVGSKDIGDFMPWDGTSTGTTYKSTSGKNWDFDPFKDVVQTDISPGSPSRYGNEESSIAIYDIDSDGDGDIILGEKSFRASGLYFFENVGNAAVAQFVRRIEPARNPFYGISVAMHMKPFVFDFDNDGDGDLLLGLHDRYLNYYENTGSATNPAYTEIVDNNRHPTPSTLAVTQSNQPTIFVVQHMTWTFVVPSQPITESVNVAVTQTSSSGTGTLAVELTGNGMISITITSAVGQIFDTAADLVVGTSRIAQASLTSVSSVTTVKEHLVIGSLNLIHFLEGGEPDSPTFAPRIGAGANPFDDIAAQAAAADPTELFLSTALALGDLDDDGDVDLIVGVQNGVLFHFRNVGSRKVAKFSLVAGTSKTDVGNLCYGLLSSSDKYPDNRPYPTPVLFDLSGDGLLDLIVGLVDSTAVYAQNTGTATSPAFTLVTGASDPFREANGDSVFQPADYFKYVYVAPFHDWMDYNGDGNTVDLVVGDIGGFVTLLQRQTDRFVPKYPSGGGPSWSNVGTCRAAGSTGYRYSTPTFNDINKDGLMDLVMGSQGGGVEYWKNTGSAGSVNSAFTKQTGAATCVETATGENIKSADTNACAAVTDLSSANECEAVETGDTTDGDAKACTYNDNDPLASISIGEYASPIFWDVSVLLLTFSLF